MNNKRMMAVMKKSFTLLEILIVLVIIGIASTFAVARYNYAVAKSKNAEAKQIVRSLADSICRYYIEAGSFPILIDALDTKVGGGTLGNVPPSSGGGFHSYYPEPGYITKYFWYYMQGFNTWVVGDSSKKWAYIEGVKKDTVPNGMTYMYLIEIATFPKTSDMKMIGNGLYIAFRRQVSGNPGIISDWND